jgi:hypothetical protein
MNSLKVRSTMPYMYGGLLKAALAVSKEFRSPLAVTASEVSLLAVVVRHISGDGVGHVVTGAAEADVPMEPGLHELVPRIGIAVGTELVGVGPEREHAAAVEALAAFLLAMNGLIMTPRCSLLSGLVILWQVSHSTPSASPDMRREPSVGVDRPAYQPEVAWHRMQRSPAPSKSCSAMARVAQKIGSRVALPIMLPRQLKAGSTARL